MSRTRKQDHQRHRAHKLLCDEPRDGLNLLGDLVVSEPARMGCACGVPCDGTHGVRMEFVM
jgi:hypothetical protein